MRHASVADGRAGLIADCPVEGCGKVADCYVGPADPPDAEGLLMRVAAAVVEELARHIREDHGGPSPSRRGLECRCIPDKTVSNYCGLHGDPTNPGGDCK